MILPLFIWVHHVFVTGVNPFLGLIFIVVVLVILLPILVAVFRKLKRYWLTNIEFNPTILFAIGWSSWIISGWISYFFLGRSTMDIHLHDTLYVISRFHIILVISIFFWTLFCIYYLYPIILKRPLNNAMGYIHFWITFIGTYLIFWPAHYEGLAGAPRRYLDYSGWHSFSQFQMVNRFVATVVILMLIAQLIFLFNIFYSLGKSRKLTS
jgi:cytochrome c oxidase subunit 1